MSADAIFAGLNPEQRRAVEAVSGPVAILAGAGSGKTTTITRRIANQVATGTFAPDQILAVTFTDKAAGELRARLQALGVAGVPARTFHAAALGQLHRFGRGPERILPSKVLLLLHLANSLPKPYRFRPAADLATEVEWAKNRRLSPAAYAARPERTPPIPHDLMASIYRGYEERKRERGLVDFEDILEGAIRLFDEDETALLQLREECRAVTVDEFQDVNLLQATLLGRWLGGREELCVVGDDHQAIYSFTGATPRYLLDLPKRFPHATVVRLEENYRSTPQVLALANRLAPALGGVEKTLRAVHADGPEPELVSLASPEAELAHVVEAIHTLHADGVPLPEVAILFRVNSRSEPWEEALGAAGIAFTVRGGAFLGRAAARRLRTVLAGSQGTELATVVRAAAQAEGLLDPPPPGLGEAEETRQADLRRLVELAEELQDGSRTVSGYLDELERRFGGSRAGGEGVSLLTYHRAKGLEFEAIFLPRLEEGELPVRQAKSEEAVDEERRLLYVGITRAKRHLSLSWTAAGKPSRFLVELGVAPAPKRAAAEPDDPLYAALKRWRLERATADELPAYVVFHNTTLAEIVRRSPRTLAELATVPGIGPAKLERYGEELLARLGVERGE